jgi:hypothetical protein
MGTPVQMGAAVDDKNAPGRPRKVAARRSKNVQARVASFHDAEKRFVETDQVVLAALRDDRLDVLHVAREALAREAAGLLFARLQCVPGSREMGRLASRRVAALREIANLTLSIARIDTGLPSPQRISKLLELLMVTIDEAAESVLPTETATAFARACRQRIEPFLPQLTGSSQVTTVGEVPSHASSHENSASRRRL